MKAELNKKNKAKFFALYWGQDVLSEWGERLIVVDGKMDRVYDISEMFLQLKPLSAISDEDFITLCEILDPNKETYQNQKDVLEYKSQIELILSETNIGDPFPIVRAFKLIDYLRSKGYALPWMGLSVEQMVESGWIKLT